MAGGGVSPYLLAGVGLPLQWDFIVPFQGRRQIVKGSIYSFHERSSPALLDDAAWRATLPSGARHGFCRPEPRPIDVPAAKPLLALAFAALAAGAMADAQPAAPQRRLLFCRRHPALAAGAAGDRAHEVVALGPARSALAGADLLIGNLEGAVGDDASCAQARDASPCFAIPPGLVPSSRAGFDAVTHENNHAGDLGPGGRAATLRALDEAGVSPVTFETSPRFLRVGDETVAVIALSLVPGRDGPAQAVPSTALAQKLRLAARLASVVVVSVHWASSS